MDKEEKEDMPNGMGVEDDRRKGGEGYEGVNREGKGVYRKRGGVGEEMGEDRRSNQHYTVRNSTAVCPLPRLAALLCSLVIPTFIN